MQIYLKKGCYLIDGAKNAAIYDLNNNKVYSINNKSKLFIKKILNYNIQDLKNTEKKYVQELINLNLLTYEQNQKETEKLKKKISIKLNFAWLELTDRCNLNCIHCYGEFGHPTEKSNKKMNTNDWQNVIDNLVKVNCNAIQFIGGEPLLYKDFMKLLNYAYIKNIKNITVFTNATLINETMVKTFKKYNINVRVSVYGHNAEVHDKITGNIGSFEKNKNALILLKKYKVNTSIAVVIMKENENFLKEIKNYIESLGYKFNGYDVIRKNNYNISNKHQIKNYDILKQKYIISPQFFINKNSFLENHYYNPCWNAKIAITSSGDILPCVFERNEKIGNIKESSYMEIKQKVKEYWTITKDLIEVCKECEYRYCCYDCRPLAKGLTGNLHAKYPRCCYNPYTGIWEDIRKCSKEIK